MIGVAFNVALQIGEREVVIAVGAQMQMEFFGVAIYLLPAQAAKLGHSQPVEDRGEEQRSPAPLQVRRRCKCAIIARISSGVGISTPIFNLPPWCRSA
jgi:hypothetical protein